jgi:DNA polymerase I
MPYFYFLPKDAGELEFVRRKLVADKEKFDKILETSIEHRKLLGKDHAVLKITCSQQDAVSTYAKGVPKAIGGGASFEDLRLPVRYVTDLMLTTCGWNECEVDPIKLDGVVADASYIATRAPRSLEDGAQPKLRLLAFTILTAARKGSAKPEQDPVRAIAVATDSGKPALFASSGDDDSETLSAFITYTRDFDPDVIVGFESNRTDWSYLMKRCKLSKKKLAVGRDFSEPHSSVFGHISITGRANLDLFDVAGSIQQVKVKNLENVARYFRLSSAERIWTIDEWDRYGLWASESGKQQLLQNTLAASQVCLELAQATIDYPIQLSAITGLPLDQVMAAAVGFRVDSYFVRQAHHIGELVPTRNEQPFFTYRGAIVLEPETGVHDNVAVLDFASMYPSLMEKYNLSPDTLVKPGEQVPDDSVYVIPEVGHRFRKEPPGFYRAVLTSLIEQRAGIKRQIENLPAGSTTFRVLKERERALKVITNACYGYAGWAGARWYVREVAESATALGRETITKTMDKAKSLGLRIIYGDTDSIFVTNEKGKIDELLEWVEKELKLEIKVGCVYVRMLFTEAMKRYAGLREDGTLDIVGLEVVRGDWSDVARQVQEQVLESILKDQSTEKAIESVRETIRRLSKGEVPIADLTIRKTLTKPIEDYAVRAPHVEVAKKLMKEGWRLALGDKVAYVVAKGPGKLFQKAKPYNQVKPEDVDIEYYVENQVKPAAMRILERFAVDEKQLAA